MAEVPIIAISATADTMPCVEVARTLLRAADFEVVVFPATGSGGLLMEGQIRGGRFAGVLDLTMTELVDDLIGGVMSAGPDRLTAAAMAAVPQVISVGAVDRVRFGPPDTVPDTFRGRRLHLPDPSASLVRTTPEENDRIGQQIVQKASASRGPTAVLLPLRGVSSLDVEGGPFWWPEADAALFQSCRNWAYGFELVECEMHVNDPAFAEAAVAKLRELMRSDD